MTNESRHVTAVDVGPDLDTVPKKWRRIWYPIGLGLSAVSGLTAAIVAIWLPEFSEQALATAAAITTFTGVVGNGLGTGYRP